MPAIIGDESVSVMLKQVRQSHCNSQFQAERKTLLRDFLTGYSPKIASQVLLDLLLRRSTSFAAQQGVHGHHKPRGAESALAAM